MSVGVMKDYKLKLNSVRGESEMSCFETCFFFYFLF
jgi:hypothetical protein